MCNAAVCGVQRAPGPQNENYRWLLSCPVQVQVTEPGSFGRAVTLLTTELLLPSLGSFEKQLTKRCFPWAWTEHEPQPTGKAVAGW